MDIRERTRKEIETPGGYKVTIRKLNLFSFMETGTIPDVLTSTDPKVLEKKVQESPNALKGIMKVCLVEGVVEGDLNIVDKSPRGCSGEEISYQEVPQDDAVYIIDQVMEFSDLTGGVAEKAKPFSRKNKTANSNRQNGPKI
jgi:hypothetical protein